MGKKGQVIVFVILGIVIFAVVALFFLVLKPKMKAPVDSSDDYEKAFYLANSCVETSAKKAVWTSVNRGFYDEIVYSNTDIITYNESFYDKLNASNIYVLEQIRPVYLNKGTTKMPTLSDAEKVLSKTFNKYFDECVNASNISVQFDEFNMGQTTSVVEINAENVLFKVGTDITLKNQGVTSFLNEFTYSLNYPLKDKYDNVKDFVEKQSKNDAFVISYLSVLAKTNNFVYTLEYYEYNTLIFELTYDDYIPIYGEKLVYGFTVKYNWPQEVLG